MAARKLGKITIQNSALFLCDMQEGFRKTIQYYPQIIEVSRRMLEGAKALGMPIIVTEQYPKGQSFGSWHEEVGLSDRGSSSAMVYLLLVLPNSAYSYGCKFSVNNIFFNVCQLAILMTVGVVGHTKYLYHLSPGLTLL